MAESATQGPKGDAIERLAVGLIKTSRDDVYPSPERKEVHIVLQNAMLAVGGYGDYFSAKIREARQAFDSAETPSRRSIQKAKLMDTQADAFEILGLVPGPESVKILGEYLSDETGRVPPSPPGSKDDRMARQQDANFTPNSFYALMAIADLPLVAPPVARRKGNATIYDSDIDAWRLWYEQVKSGKRTFRFEGDPREYNLDGPTKTAVSQVQGPRVPAGPGISPAPKEAAGVVVAQARVDDPSQERRWPLWAALGVLAVGVAVYVRRKGKGLRRLA